MTDTTEPLFLGIGRASITRDGDRITLESQVTGGGANGPGVIREARGYSKTSECRWDSDDRSGSKRSGTCTWLLRPNRLYVLSGIAANSSRSMTGYLSTFGDDIEELDRDEFEEARREQWPLEYQDHLDATAAAEKRKAEHRENERRLAAEREVARAALAEMNAERAAAIEANGQPEGDGLPKLTGTPKQVAYALSIRTAFAATQPKATSLKTATTAKYWIENHRSVLYR